MRTGGHIIIQVLAGLLHIGKGQPIDALSGDLNVASGSLKRIGNDIIILLGEGNHKGGGDTNIATISASSGRGSRCGGNATLVFQDELFVREDVNISPLT